MKLLIRIAMALLLVVWNRIGTDHADLTLTGDPVVAASFRNPG